MELSRWHFNKMTTQEKRQVPLRGQGIAKHYISQVLPSAHAYSKPKRDPWITPQHSAARTPQAPALVANSPIHLPYLLLTRPAAAAPPLKDNNT
ncbi:conserved hypothetical protein [Ricinus communis]|uniref:Uncharacterized protein n=1 Tax=Ricinus communis TaxID=3988 RepID=B9RXR1_RICCO|nr:conserved hypothetical protein [Ricinus communis]